MRETEGETPRQIFVDAHKVPDGEIGKTYIPAALASPHSLWWLLLHRDQTLYNRYPVSSEETESMAR